MSEKERTIVDAIKEVMKAKGRPMTVMEVYDAIIDADLYTFHADNPAHIVRSQIRRHCKDLDYPSASPTKHFRMLQNGTYYLLSSPIKQKTKGASKAKTSSKDDLLVNLKKLHERYLDDFQRRILEKIKRLEPSAFEVFSKKLLEAYGFQNMVVTQPSKDGGIDGYGVLKIGLVDLKVAFQSKRWRSKCVGRREVNQFRGDIQGQYEQGYFFTTATFSSEAKSVSLRAGAVPIILVDGTAIVDLMIEKKFGVETEALPIHSYALDLIISDDDA